MSVAHHATPYPINILPLSHVIQASIRSCRALASVNRSDGTCAAPHSTGHTSSPEPLRGRKIGSSWFIWLHNGSIWINEGDFGGYTPV